MAKIDFVVVQDLKTWQSQGEWLFEKTPLTDRFDDGSCPNFLAIGDKHIVLFFSHRNGGQYFVGDYDGKSHEFRPYDHGRFNHGRVAPGGVHAPSAAADGKGGVINILNINDARHSPEWDQIMSLPQRLTLGVDKRIRIEPIETVASLRGSHRHVSGRKDSVGVSLRAQAGDATLRSLDAWQMKPIWPVADATR